MPGEGAARNVIDTWGKNPEMVRMPWHFWRDHETPRSVFFSILEALKKQQKPQKRGEETMQKSTVSWQFRQFVVFLPQLEG